MSKPKFFITDVFTDRKFGGNPLATFIDCESLSDEEMQQIAREINFSETTFITSREQHNGGYDVRIFTPRAEVAFAGHPTLGTAHVIRNTLKLTDAKEITLNLRVGQIPVAFTGTSAGKPVLWMKQMPPQFGKQLDLATLADVLSLAPSDIVQDFPIEEVSTGFPTIIVPLKNLDALKRVVIDKENYYALVDEAWAKIILVFSREAYEPGQALSVRMFADYYGVPEDPATGSSTGSLAAYLAQHRVLGSREIAVDAGQGYEMGRPSTLSLRTGEKSGGIEVFVGGRVVDVARGEWG
jgi:trans-2,3-dihydro-3-hydroxyanthranilate isomerase